MISVIVRIPVAMKRYHDQGKSYQSKHLVGADLQFQRLSPPSSWQEAWQYIADMVLEKEPKVLLLDLKVARRRLSPCRQPEETTFCTGQSMSTGGLKAHLH